ncbi:hypothetical protein GYA49_04655 [Candidatus Beckwithbacteria bacterium]|nr:hypothetical protein [Candidatus Beckwithbacteria bacterium]
MEITDEINVVSESKKSELNTVNYESSDSTQITSSEFSVSNKKNLLIKVGLLAIFLILSTGLIILYVKNKKSGGIDKKIQSNNASVQDSKKTASHSGSFADLILEDVYQPSSTSSPTPSPKSTTTPAATTIPKPTPTPTPIPDDIELTNLYISNQYNSPNDSTSYNSNGDPDIQTFEERRGPSGIIASQSFKNNGPNPLNNIKYQLWINGEFISETMTETINPFEVNNVNGFYSLPSSPGTYIVEVKVNPDHTVPENNYNNNNMSKKYIVINDITPPNIMGINTTRDNVNKQTCLSFGFNDNISEPTEMKYYEKLDAENYHEISWDHSVETGYRRCLSGPAGEAHSYHLKITDKRDNTAEKTLNFELYAF